MHRKYQADAGNKPYCLILYLTSCHFKQSRQIFKDDFSDYPLESLVLFHMSRVRPLSDDWPGVTCQTYDSPEPGLTC